MSNPTDVRYLEGLNREVADRRHQVQSLNDQIHQLEVARDQVAKELAELESLENHVKGKKP